MDCASAHINKSQPVSLFRQPRISLGLKQMAYVTVCGAFEDAMGRAPSHSDSRRRQAAAALHWLRDHESTQPFSLSWCSEVLNVDSHWLAFHGIVRLQNSGLEHWRLWRKQRNGNRIARLPIFTMQCRECGEPFRTKHHERIFCSKACQHEHAVHRYDSAAEQEELCDTHNGIRVSLGSSMT